MNGNPYYEPYWESDELEHYGVLGMKWGVRKDPDKAYSKAGAKLEKLDRKAQKQAIKGISKEGKAAKKQRKASSALLFQRSKAKRASKATRKALKQYQKSQETQIKAKKWSDQMDKVFSKVKVNNLNQNYVDLGKRYAAVTIDDLMKNNTSVNAMMSIDEYYRRMAQK